MTNQVTDRVEIDLPAAAIGLSAFRVLKNGEGRQYSAAIFREPAGLRRELGKYAFFRWISDDQSRDAYAVLDVITSDCEVVHDFTITSPDAFRRIKKLLNLEVEKVEE